MVLEILRRYLSVISGKTIFLRIGWIAGAALSLIFFLLGPHSPVYWEILLVVTVPVTCILYTMSVGLLDISGSDLRISVPSIVSTIIIGTLLLILASPFIAMPPYVSGPGSFPQYLETGIGTFGTILFLISALINMSPLAFGKRLSWINLVFYFVSLSSVIYFAGLWLLSGNLSVTDLVLLSGIAFLAGNLISILASGNRLDQQSMIYSSLLLSFISFVPAAGLIVGHVSPVSLYTGKILLAFLAMILMFSWVSAGSAASILQKRDPLGIGFMLIPVILLPAFLALTPNLSELARSIAFGNIVQTATTGSVSIALMVLVGSVTALAARIRYTNRDLLQPVFWSSSLAVVLTMFDSLQSNLLLLFTIMLLVFTVAMTSVTISDIVFQSKLSDETDEEVPEEEPDEVKTEPSLDQEPPPMEAPKSAGTYQNVDPSRISKKINGYRILGGKNPPSSPFYLIDATFNEESVILKVPKGFVGNEGAFFSDEETRNEFMSSLERFCEVEGLVKPTIVGDNDVREYLLGYLKEDVNSVVLMEKNFNGMSLDAMLEKENSGEVIAPAFLSCLQIIRRMQESNVLHLGLSPSSIFFTWSGDNAGTVSADDLVSGKVSAIFFNAFFAPMMLNNNLLLPFLSSYFLPPEIMVRGYVPDWRTDVYSLALSLSFRALGKIQDHEFNRSYQRQIFLKNHFSRRITFRSMNSLLNDFGVYNLANPSQVDPGFDPRLSDIIVRCTRLDPSERYGSIGEIEDDLRAIIGAREQ